MYANATPIYQREKKLPTYINFLVCYYKRKLIFINVDVNILLIILLITWVQKIVTYI